MQASLQERLWAGLGAVLIVALLGYALLSGLHVRWLPRPQQALALLDLAVPPPAKRPETPVVHREARAAREAPAPPNLRSKATPIVARPPVVPLKAPPPVIAAPVAGVGMAPSSGASDRPGPGTGAGGEGYGTGGGGDGGDGDDIPPRQTRGRLKFSDLPQAMRDEHLGGSVGVRYSVEVDGHVGECGITRSSGRRDLDALTCDLIRERFRFKPSRDAEGHPVRSYIVETHSWEIERDPDEEESRP